VNRQSAHFQAGDGLAKHQRAPQLLRKCSCGSHTASSGECAECAQKKNNLQRKLRIGAANDPLEHEADRVADQVMRRTPHSAAAHAPISIQRMGSSGGSFEGDVPDSVKRTLSGSGRALDASLSADMGARFGRDFSHVRVHQGGLAEQSARDVSARAYTVGRDVVFGAGEYAPGSQAGQRLIAHELAHVAQQTSALASCSDLSKQHHFLRRIPEAPSSQTGPVPYDRQKVDIEKIPDFDGVSGGNAIIQTVGVTISEIDASHLSWELYDSKDKLIGGRSTLPHSPEALSSKYSIQNSVVNDSQNEGRFTLRCTARKKGIALAYSDQTFFVWKSNALALADRTTLKSVMDKPNSNSLGKVGAAKARDLMLEHQEKIKATGTGTTMGNKCGAAVQSGVAASDCTQYVYDVLKYAFSAKGMVKQWKDVVSEAAKLSGTGGLRGTALQLALENVAGWRGVFWAPSPRNPQDGSSEHPVAYNRAKKDGKYSKDDVLIEKNNLIVNYRPKSSTFVPTMDSLDKLKKVSLGIISARGGTHMTFIINGKVYEVHWLALPTDPNVFQSTPLEDWEWQSGTIVMPDEDFKAAFAP
jgi:Domain of unknown function (DUF4157)